MFREYGLPIRMQDYFTYIDLVVRICKARSKTWQVGQLEIYV
jgi:hypothetical protein